MVDPIDTLIGAGAGAGLGSLVMSLLKGSAARNISTLDKTLEHLEKSIKDQAAEMRQLIGELTHEMRQLRDTDIGQAKDIGALQKGLTDLEKRVDGQGAHYREQLEEHRRLIFAQLKETVEEVAAKARKR